MICCLLLAILSAGDHKLLLILRVIQLRKRVTRFRFRPEHLNSPKVSLRIALVILFS
jgi:hypothetical protein